MEESERLIERLDQGRRAMRALVTELDTSREIYPQWTIKEILAHIAGWDEVVTAALRAHAGGNEPDALAVKGVDAYNALLAQACEPLTVEQVVKDWKQARSQLKAALSELPPEKFREPLNYPWGWRGSVAQVVAILADHEKEHAEDILGPLSTEIGEEST